MVTGVEPESRYARVLLVNGEPFSNRCATGLTLQSLFRGWPRDRLGFLFLSPLEPMHDMCAQYWRLGPGNIPFQRAVRRSVGKPLPIADSFVPSAPSQAQLVGVNPDIVLNHWTDHSRLWDLAKTIASKHSLTQLAQYQVPEDVIRAIDRFRPEVIYTMLGANAVLRLVLDVHERCHVPIVPHIMDDWPSTLYLNSIFRPLLRYRMHRDWKRVLSLSPVRLTIGQEMACEYSRRYGGAFTPFMNAVEREWLENPTDPPPAAPRVIFTYIGGLHLNRWRSLREIGLELAELRNGGLEAELRVYTQPRFTEDAKRLEVPGVVRLMGSLDPGEVAGALRAAHVLVHVESFDEDSRKYTRYSVSTKIPECMGAQRPILAYGPAELASISYVSEVRAGVSVGERNSLALRAGLKALIESNELRLKLAAAGWEAAAQRHDAQRQRESFRALLAAVADGCSSPTRAGGPAARARSMNGSEA